MVQAVVLLAHFHSLSSFIHGCGITPEVDFDNGHTFLVEPTSLSSPDKHPSVSFAVGPPSIVTTTNTLSCAGGGGVPSKASKSILKKTDLSTSPPSSSQGSSHSTSGGINVPSVHFHPYHSSHHPRLHGGSPVLKSDTTFNSMSSSCSPPRPGSTVSEVDLIMATMKNLSETVPIEE